MRDGILPLVFRPRVGSEGYRLVGYAAPVHDYVGVEVAEFPEAQRFQGRHGQVQAGDAMPVNSSKIYTLLRAMKNDLLAEKGTEILKGNERKFVVY